MVLIKEAAMVWVIVIGVVQFVMCVGLLFVVMQAIKALNEYKATLDAFRDILLKSEVIRNQYEAAMKKDPVK